MKKLFIITTLLSLFAISATAQFNVAGIVVDENGEGIPGVNIMIKGTSDGTISDIDGNYKITTPTWTDILTYSFIGYEKHEEEINKRKSIDVMMTPNAEMLEEVVAVGYSQMRKKDVTGAMVKISSEDILKGTVANYDQALSGRMAGVQVSAADGTPGAAMDIVIRGGNSITGDNSPLYVVDNVPMEDFDPGSISSHDIAEFNVLKDASATAIYGSRGANGVIQITTKSGRDDGRTTINFNASVGIQNINSRLEVMSPYDFVLLEQEAATNKGGTYIETFNEHWIDPALYTEEALAARGEEATSWQDEIFRSSLVQNYNFSLNGGSKTTNIYYSGDYIKQEGTLINTGYNRINNNIKIQHRINKKAQVGAYVNYSNIKRYGQDVSGNNRHSVIKDAITFRPVTPIVDDGRDGGLDYDGDPNELRFNPVKTLENTDRYIKQDVMRSNAYLNYTFSKYLLMKVSGAYQVDNRKESLFYGADTYSGTKGTDGINGKLTDRRYQTLSTSNTLRYKRKIKYLHDITALAGFEAQQRHNEYFTAQNSQMLTDQFGTDKMQIGTSPELSYSDLTENSMASFFGSVNYGYNGRYLLTANFRTDGSSKFQKKNRWGYFPSFAAAWRLGEENFIRDLNTFSNLKLRAGFGITGNNRVGDYVSVSQLNVSDESGYSINNQYNTGVYNSNLASSDLKWETTKQTNIGIDMGFFNNRLSAVVDYYRKNTSDLLLYAEMAPSMGFSQVFQNIGEVQNQGLEFSINSTNIDANGFRWTSAFNISFNQNKTIALTSGQDKMYTNPDWYFKYTEYQYITEIGQPVGMFYGLKSDGIYQLEDFNYNASTNLYELKSGIPDNGATVAPGSVKFKDLNNDGTINENDRTVIGNPHPKHFGGLSNDFKYKGFDLSVFFQWSYGNEILNANRVAFESPTNSSGYNYLASVADRWTVDNPDGTIHGIQFKNGGDNVYGTAPDGNKVSDMLIEDGSFLRFKTLALGYSFNEKFNNRLKIDKCRVFLSAQNLYTWTNYSGFDPEVSVGKYGALTPGLDYSAYPISASYTAGVQLTF